MDKEVILNKIDFLEKKAHEYRVRSKKENNPNKNYHSGYADAILFCADELKCLLEEMDVN